MDISKEEKRRLEIIENAQNKVSQSVKASEKKHLPCCGSKTSIHRKFCQTYAARIQREVMSQKMARIWIKKTNVLDEPS
jgi:hypothetical protein